MLESIPIEVSQPGASRRERADAAANRARILAEAERLFQERGVEAVTMADIAQAAGVGKGTLYRRFCNKGELCLSLLDSQMQAYQDRQLVAMRQMTAAGMPYVEQLMAFLTSLVAFTGSHAPLLQEVQHHSESLDEAHVERPHFWQYMTVHGLLRRAVSAGELPAGLDIDFVAEALLAPLGAQTYQFQIEGLNFTPERIARGLHTVLRGLSHS